MPGANRINHVSVHADDLEESVRFYTDVLGMERIPTYTFHHPVQYLRCGESQLHLFERPTTHREYHHFGLDVDDFEAIYERVKRMGIFEEESFFSPIYELPDGCVQMFLRDPAGNLVEINWPDVNTLDRSIVGEIRKLADEVEQGPESERATLYYGVDNAPA